ncbi:hypothetical protein MAFF211471_53530 (plasmid) [Ralstonia solanacearum]|nr:hypothetical protein MAFF211471_53530 [Ralstonia solanacearum]BEU54913.1 hypothetical protein MAFF211520_52050 [Ralstonia pseudosolanacearum]BCM10777.1 hypothetical protein MAFF241647_51340 [Ralstonia solanacearum]BCN02829.1 hypothetical protein RPSA_53650 [Ralstonia solanacearum]BEU60166.1 hypothetical protein MAFF211521_52190 [Ralstonia pseudosolanacearum]
MTTRRAAESASGPRSPRRTFAWPPAERESRHRAPANASGPIRHPGRNPAERNTPAHKVTQKWVRGCVRPEHGSRQTPCLRGPNGGIGDGHGSGKRQQMDIRDPAADVAARPQNKLHI